MNKVLYENVMNELKKAKSGMLIYENSLFGDEEKKLISKLSSKAKEISSFCDKVSKQSEEHDYMNSLTDVRKSVQDLEVLLKILTAFAKTKIDIYCD